MSEFSPEDRNMCGFCTKYLPTCEFHCWALDNGRCFLSPDDRLTVRQKPYFFPTRHVYKFFSLHFSVGCWFSFFFTLATVWLICLCTCAHNFRQTTLLIIKAEIYHQIKMINIFFVLSVLSLWSSWINKLFGSEQMNLFPFSRKKPVYKPREPKI